MAETYTYKGLTLNDSTYEPPEGVDPDWGGTENQKDQDVADWVGGDAIDTDLDTGGHKHNKLYDNVGTNVIEADTSSTRIGSGSDLVLINVKDSSDYGMAIVGNSAADIFLEVDSVNDIVRVGHSSYPMRFESDGDMYTRKENTVAYNLVNVSETSTSIIAKARGKTCELFVNFTGIASALSADSRGFSLPFHSLYGAAELGVFYVSVNSVMTAVRVSVELGGDGTYLLFWGIPAEAEVAIAAVFNIPISDPDFTNTVA